MAWPEFWVTHLELQSQPVIVVALPVSSACAEIAEAIKAISNQAICPATFSGTSSSWPSTRLPGWCRASPVRGQTARGSCGRSSDGALLLHNSVVLRKCITSRVRCRASSSSRKARTTLEPDYRAPVERNQNPAKRLRAKL